MTIQVLTTRNRDKAKKAVEELKKQGFIAWYTIELDNKGTYYSVNANLSCFHGNFYICPKKMKNIKKIRKKYTAPAFCYYE